MGLGGGVNFAGSDERTVIRIHKCGAIPTGSDILLAEPRKAANWPGLLSSPETAGKMRHHFRACWGARAALVLPLLAATRVSLFAQAPCTVDFPYDANPTSITDEDICNFHKVDSQVYRGGRPDPSAYPKLEQLGVRTILSLEESARDGKERDALARFNSTLKPENRIDFVSFPITQTQISRTGLSDEQVERLFQLIRKARKPLFIHCYYGRDRTGAIIALYRMALEGVPYEKAYEEAVHYKFSPEDAGLLKTLKRYKNPKRLSPLSAR
jgi:protein-tyrosine phosphatase